ncbi:EamA family transporter RarD [Roseobacter weihaiensis]|uniref:EamA family transporter RarD n=1 Tax=Roseobacter weihaiensis TaxID=2763262 RepID=UPI001D0B2C4C|nr:EamA family transporter RarD [Roseobacter sp. H9]
MTSTDADSPRGFGFAVSAYFLWGFLPIYMKALSHISPFEVLAHRVLWSVPIAAVALIALRRTKELRAALLSPGTLAMGCVTATLISINWGVYIWAIVSGHALDAALGYYINPLFSVFLGALLLGERLNRLKWAAILLALAAVVILTVESGSVPLVAIALTVSWGFYAYFKKSLPVGPNQGFLLEVLLLTPPAVFYVVFLGLQDGGHFMTGEATDTWLLLGCGLVTAIPLMLYANGAKLLRLSTIGMLQYIAPTMIFLIAVFVFGEPFGQARMIAFPLIWLALVLYSYALWRDAKEVRRTARP